MNSQNNEYLEVEPHIRDQEKNIISLDMISNAKKRHRESFDMDLSVGTRRAKIGSYDDFNENERPNASDNISSPSKNNSSTFYDYITKNDAMNIIWKLVIPKTQIISMGNIKKSCAEKFISKRRDVWNFDLELSGRGFNLTIKCDKQNKAPVSCLNDNIILIEKVFNSISFDVDVSFQIVNYKTQNFAFKNIQANSEEYSKDIILQNDFLNINYCQTNANTRSTLKEKSSEDKDNIIVVIEMSISKNFDYKINNEEGYIGIINEAATCYMNSMLQTLNIIGEFKKAVFQIPTDDEDYNSVSLSLQRLFYDLMKDQSPVSTNRLVKSFGWGREQILVQHDVQEFNLLLSDVMEKKMKGTPSEGTFSKLLEGKLINYIQCVDVNYKSEKEEKFNDLQLTVKGCKNIYESLNSYTEEETLDNEDKYEAEGHGRQKAKKGIRFSKFPSVLILQLKRFEYNPKREAMVKINDYFEYYDEIDLSKYMNNNLDEASPSLKEDNLYTLHSIVVHQGNANSGHYYAFIRPTEKDLWMQFNDEIVRPADKYEVFDNNFGGTYTTYKNKNKGEVISITNYFESNAYILVYIKNSERPRILSPMLCSHISPNLVTRFELEKKEERKILMKKIRMVENLNIILLSKESVFSDNNKNKLGIVNSFVDLNCDSPLIINKKQRMLINFPKYLTIMDFLNFIQSETNIPSNLMKIFEYQNGDASSEGIIKNRANYELIPIEEKNYDKTLFDFTNTLKKRLITFFLYIQEDKFKIFSDGNFNSKEEWRIESTNNNCMSDNTCSEKIVFISKDLNGLTFYKNDNNLCQSIDSSNIQSNNMFKLLFVKEYDSESSKFVITKIIQINLEIHCRFSDIENLVINKEKHKLDKENEFVYLIERTCLHEKLSNSNNNLFLSECNFYEVLTQVSSVIIIPIIKSEEDTLREKIESLYNTIFVDVYSLAKSEYVIKKMKINYQNVQEENQVKSLILENIIERRLFKEIFSLDEHYYIDQNKNLFKLEENFLEKFITIDFFELQTERDKGPKFLQACKENPFLKYLNPNECRIEFDLHLFSSQLTSDFSFQQISLFNIENKRICKLSVIFPRKIRKCRELIDYIYDTVLNDRNFIKEKFQREDYFFILQNAKKSYIYQILTDNNTELSLYNSKAENIEFRLQPFSYDEMMAFQNSNYYKIFIAVQGVGMRSSDNHQLKIEPIIIYAEKSTTVFELKFMLMERITKMSLHFDLENETIIKYYIAKVYDGKIHKDMNLHHFKEEETLEIIFRDKRAYNILVEIIKNINK